MKLLNNKLVATRSKVSYMFVLDNIEQKSLVTFEESDFQLSHKIFDHVNHLGQFDMSINDM